MYTPTFCFAQRLNRKKNLGKGSQKLWVPVINMETVNNNKQKKLNQLEIEHET